MQSETSASTHEYSGCSRADSRASKYVTLLSYFGDEYRGLSPVSVVGLRHQLVLIPPTCLSRHSYIFWVLIALYLYPGLPRLIEVGCYKDSGSNRALRTLIGFLRREIDWYNLRSMVAKCAERAWQRGFR